MKLMSLHLKTWILGFLKVDNMVLQEIRKSKGGAWDTLWAIFPCKNKRKSKNLQKGNPHKTEESPPENLDSGVYKGGEHDSVRKWKF